MMQIVINFDDVYDPISVEPGMVSMTFIAPQKDGTEKELLVDIVDLGNPFLHNVYNLGFGPPGGKGSFVGNVRLKDAKRNYQLR
ncbi:hypothetical protein AAFN85_31680 [Mucilaginibacter sp. CAU 1740]|uniref:hypothetical protein n=1 Tax=Mucilaginibacter sp. CAU 1740 TaxID=3140365 RepID=UPI00325B754C